MKETAPFAIGVLIGLGILYLSDSGHMNDSITLALGLVGGYGYRVFENKFGDQQ